MERQLQRAAPRQATGHLPERPPQRPLGGAHRSLTSAPIQPRQQLPGHTAGRGRGQAGPARLRFAGDPEHHRGLAPEGRGKRHLQDQPDRGPVVPGHPLGGPEQGSGERGLRIRRRQDLPRFRFRSLDIVRGDDPDQLAAADRHHHPCSGHHPVAQRLGDGVGVRLENGERKGDVGVTRSHAGMYL